MSACCLLAFIGTAGAGVPEGREAFEKSKFADARRELADLARQGDAEAMALMGEMLMRGLGGERDELTARDYIQQASEKDNLRATFQLALMYLGGNLVARDEAKGLELLKRAADGAYAPAQSRVGLMIANGTNGYQKDEATALTWFRAAAAQKDAVAMLFLGNFYDRGAGGLPVDALVALDWYRKSAELGNSQAMALAGAVYAFGKGVSPDGTEALKWLRRSAAQGNHYGFSLLGNVFEFGRGGVAKNLPLAFSWYAAIPSNTAPSTAKLATEGKERLAKLLSPAEITEAEKQAKVVVAQNVVNIITAAGALQSGSGVGAAASRKGPAGSGVVVSAGGDILTNEHVVQGCARLKVQPLGEEARLVAKDAKNDLALLRLEKGQLPPAKLRAGRGIRSGDELVAMGYPLRGVLAGGPVVTTGIVNALSGVGNDTSAFQMSATVQPGSSGGPVFDRYGLLVGIVRSRLLSTSAINAQNVNFGINLGSVSAFLDANAVNYTDAPVAKNMVAVSDLVARLQPATVQIECF